MLKLRPWVCIAGCILMCLTIWAQDEESGKWIDLFNGSNLDGWQQLNGNAKYHVEDDMIVGTSVSNTPNSFLATNEVYGDFILEFDVLCDVPLNSGVQIRSESKPSYRNGRVHGYQVEIEGNGIDRLWSGGIYDEGRRGWLYPLTVNQTARSAFLQGRWNRYRIECHGPHIRTWINGVQCANLVDDMTLEGFIALQVHSISNESLSGKKIRWKRIRILTEDVEDNLTPQSSHAREISFLDNVLTEEEKRTGWRLLWDGKSSNNWRGANSDAFPGQGWEMNDGVLTVLESGGGESQNGGDIVTEQQFSNFELQVDFKITEGANSGIKYFVDPDLNKSGGSAIGLEFQILDDVNHPDAKAGVNGNRTIGSLYDLIRADNFSEGPGGTKRFKGIDHWNRARIKVKDGHVEHWLNGIKVVEFNRFNQTFAALVEKSKYVVWPNFGRLESGHILLQDHGNTVHFKNIKIREF